MDCCNSGGSTRGTKDFKARHLENTPQISADIDIDILGGQLRSLSSHPFAGLNTESHVLLAACGRSETAYESPFSNHGLFSEALLDLLSRARIEEISYASLMNMLHIPK